MAKRPLTRYSDSRTTLSKNYVAIAALPNRPLNMSDILGRYIAIEGLELEQKTGVLAVNNSQLQSKKIAEMITNEIEQLYGRIGVQTMARRSVIQKILSLKDKFYKWTKKKNSHQLEDEPVCFLAKTQPQWVKMEDIEWYNVKRTTGSGSMSSVDRNTARINDLRAKKVIRQLELTEKAEKSPKVGAETVVLDDSTCSEGEQVLPSAQAVVTPSNTPSNSQEPGELQITPTSSTQGLSKRKCKRKLCMYNVDWSPVCETAIRYGGSSEFVQEILIANAKAIGSPLDKVPSRSTIDRSAKKTVSGRRDLALKKIGICDLYTVQFDGKDNFEAFMITYYDRDGKFQTLPLDVIHSKKSLTGKELGKHLTELPGIDPKEILCICSDTTNVNSGIGKVGGACYWFQELSDSACFVVMCRLHSLECIAGIALTQWNLDVFGNTPKCELGPSATVTSLQTLCYNLRELSSKHFDLWKMMPHDTSFSWPADYGVYEHDHTKYFTDVQKLFSILVTKKNFTLKDIGKRFSAVGVRWLGFLCSLLHSSLSYMPLKAALEGIPDSDIPNKTVKGYIRNSIKMLDTINGQHAEVVKDIFQFSVVYFKCWRSAVMSNGTDILQVEFKIHILYYTSAEC